MALNASITPVIRIAFSQCLQLGKCQKAKKVVTLHFWLHTACSLFLVLILRRNFLNRHVFTPRLFTLRMAQHCGHQQQTAPGTCFLLSGLGWSTKTWSETGLQFRSSCQPSPWKELPPTRSLHSQENWMKSYWVQKLSGRNWSCVGGMQWTHKKQPHNYGILIHWNPCVQQRI